jgi:hypothetical protein
VTAFAGHTMAQAAETKWRHFGRWTVDDPTDKFSPNGKLYRIVDIAPCGKDLCGVSVDGGNCGATLFRFFSTHDQNDTLVGHGKWGADQLKLFVFASSDQPSMTLSMGGPKFDPESRSGSVPTFTADYHRIGDAQCKADAPGV